jgi:hypothetical protein
LNRAAVDGPPEINAEDSAPARAERK